MDGTENPLAHALEQQQQLWRDCFYFLFGEVEKEKLCARCMVVASCYLCCLRKKNRQFCDLERNVEGW